MGHRGYRRIMKKLPNKLSELIRLAMKDLELVENDEKYKVDMDMGSWHFPWFSEEAEHFDVDDEVEVCNVCLAGAVMAKTLDYALWSEGDFNSGDEHADHFYFLDQIRQYGIYDDYAEGIIGILGKSDEEVEKIQSGLNKVDDFIVHDMGNKFSYENDPEQFRKNMLLIADKFEEVGL